MQQEEIARAIGARVRATRAQVGLSRRRLAAAAGVSERYLNELEKGQANPSVGILVRVADALAVDLSGLLPTARGVTATGPGVQPVYGPLADLLGSMSLSEKEGAIPHLARYLKDRRRALKGIALLGLRGAGKSTIGGLFAQRHGLPFLSITREVETRVGMSLDDLFNLGGVEAYRTIENEVVGDLARRNDRIVLETAGGIVGNGEALDVILGSFKTVWLRAAPEDHLARVTRQGDMRPMHGNPMALEHLKGLLAQREAGYARAESALDTTGKSPQECVAELERIAAPMLASHNG